MTIHVHCREDLDFSLLVQGAIDKWWWWWWWWWITLLSLHAFNSFSDQTESLTFIIVAVFLFRATENCSVRENGQSSCSHLLPPSSWPTQRGPQGHVCSTRRGHPFSQNDEEIGCWVQNTALLSYLDNFVYIWSKSISLFLLSRVRWADFFISFIMDPY